MKQPTLHVTIGAAAYVGWSELARGGVGRRGLSICFRAGIAGVPATEAEGHEQKTEEALPDAPSQAEPPRP